MGQTAGQVQRNLVDYVLTLDPAEGLRELPCVLSAIGNLGEQLKRGVDPEVVGSVLVLLSGVGEGIVEQIRSKPGGLAAAPKDPGSMCATQLVAAQIATMQSRQG